MLKDIEELIVFNSGELNIEKTSESVINHLNEQLSKYLDLRIQMISFLRTTLSVLDKRVEKDMLFFIAYQEFNKRGYSYDDCLEVFNHVIKTSFNISRGSSGGVGIIGRSYG